MKKFIYLIFTSLFFLSCSLDDDGTRIVYEYSEITSADLPESFEKGKTYQIDITYLLPSACHTAAGIEVKRGNSAGDARRDIYVAGVSTFDANQAECTRDGNNLEIENHFSIFIDEDEPYKFYLWIGVDDEMESQYTIVEVPVE